MADTVQLKLRNKIIAAVLVAALAGVALYFFSGFFLSKTSPKSQENTSEKKNYKLTFGHSMPLHSAIDIAARKFVEVVSQKTNGAVTITIYPNQELANDHKMIEMAVEGDLDILLTPTAKMGTVIPALQYSDIPFLFPHKEDVYEMLAGEPGRLLLQKVSQYGLIGTTFWGSGFKQFTANKDIHSPKDFKDMNVRIMKSPLIMDQFREFGANPIPIDFHETYKALKDGVVEAEENPIVVIDNMKFHEVQSHIIISNHAYLAYVFSFSKKNFEKLPQDIQQILMTTAKELAGYTTELIDAQESDILKKLANAGMKITYLTDDEIKEFQLATKGILYKYTPIIGSDVIDATLKYLQQKYKYVSGDDIIVGLNADMTLGTSMSGIAIERGMKIAAKEINEKGGILGKKLIVVTMDHAGNTARSNENIRLFAKIKNLVAVMGGLHSHIVMADIDSVHLFKMIYLLPWTTHPQVVQNGHETNYVFRLSANDTYAGPFLLEQALKRTRKIALLRVNTVWGNALEEIMVNYLKEQGLEFTAIESFNLGETDFHEQIERITRAGTEIIIMAAYTKEGANIIKYLFYGKNKIPVISHMAITGDDLYKEIKKELKTINLSFMQTDLFITANNNRSKEFINRYMNEYGVKTPQEIFSPHGTSRAYDLVMLLAEAIRHAGTLKRAEIRDSMESLQHYEGLTRMHSPPFTKTRHDALDEKGYFMAEFDNNGAIIPVSSGKK